VKFTICILTKTRFQHFDDSSGVAGAGIHMRKMKRFTFEIPPALHRRIKIQCAIDDTKMTDVMRVLLERAFNRQERQDGAASSATTAEPKHSAEAV
jgi:hypothetical protein